MEGIIHAMLENDVSYEQFLRFVTDYDIQEDPYIREVLNQLLTEESNTRAWTVQDADDLLDMLKSPEKTQPRPPLTDVQTTVQPHIAPQGFVCDQCDKTFTQKQVLNRHIKTTHQKITYSCPKCLNMFTRQSNLRQHEVNCKGIIDPASFTCHKCQKTFACKRNQVQHESQCQGIVRFPCDQCKEVLKTIRELQFHKKIKHKPTKQKSGKPTKTSSPKPGQSMYNCRRCQAKFQHPKQLQVHNARQHKGRLSTRQAFNVHNVQVHYQVGGGLHPMPFSQGKEPWIEADGSVNEGLRDCYMTNRPLILERFREGPVESLYNIPMYPDMRIWDIGQALQGIYDRQRHAFKVNLAFGFIIRHVETGQYRYFRPFDNVNIFDAPILISRRSDIGKILKKT